MKAREIKEYIFENEKVEYILEKLGMHHIKKHQNYYTCGVPTGDNTISTSIYNNKYLNVKAYTRDIEDENGISDLISLIRQVKDFDFIQAIDWLHKILGLQAEEEYAIKTVEQINPSSAFIERLNIDEKVEKQREIKLYEKEILKKYYFSSFIEKDFKNDNIPQNIQCHFCLIPFTDDSYYYPNDYMVIPIFDEIGNLAGTKLRITRACQYNNKYFYKESCDKNSILYGLYQTKYYIDQKKEVIICEAEKGVMQLYSYGYKNAVAVGGHDISNTQVEKIIKLDVDKVIIAFDEDVQEKVLKKEYEKLCDFVEVTCIIDINNILNEKESPMDDPKKWEKLYNNYQMIPSETRKIEKKEEIKELEQVTEDDFEF